MPCAGGASRLISSEQRYMLSVNFNSLPPPDLYLFNFYICIYPAFFTNNNTSHPFRFPILISINSDNITLKYQPFIETG